MKRATILVLAGVLLSTMCGFSTVGVTFYSPDREHLWNRLYTTLFVRVASDGAVYDDLLDPPFWARTGYLLAGESHDRALALLPEFSKKKRLRDDMPALKRAMMQRDLIAVFFWLTGPRTGERKAVSSVERELGIALARVIRFVALPENVIRNLPNNYEVAVGAKSAPTEFDARSPNQAFLPADLLDDSGPWIAVEENGDDLLAATRHLKVFQGRSAFEVRMRHADGRAAGEAYLRELASMSEPVLSEKPAGEIGRRSLGTTYGWLNPATPQFPTNTAWALVRRAVLFAAEGDLIVSPIVESIQLRVYRAVDPDDMRDQCLFEWELRRKTLFGKGGFRESQPGEDSFPHFMGKGYDPFEEYGRFELAAKPASLNCLECHSGLGIHSVNSRTRLFEGSRGPAELVPVTAARIAQITELNARALPEWTLLRWLGSGESSFPE
jgi:hypothetical protein